ncbi:penicillin acylase family protein, partial [Hydrogenophaga sp.]|uniref:penicillin acylase family protein n=1 Tax=Hydrogenophaga sp. TaxID=1904254 RepID=UPI003565A573
MALLAVLVAAAGSIYVARSLPQVDGELQLSGLRHPVQVRRDASDVTHIQALEPHDAWMAMGYVHAQERAWQLEFNRRLMRGTLSEILGPATLETDVLLRTLGIREAAQRQLAGLPEEARVALQAYSDGINAFFADGQQALPPEFQLLGVNPREAARAGRYWDALDSAGWSIMMALDLGGNWGNEFARLSALQVLDTDQLWQLFPAYPGEPPASQTDLARLYRDLHVYRPATQQLPATRQSLAEPLPSGFSAQLVADMRDWTRELGNIEGKGSNNWVVDGSRSATGMPLL